MSARNLNTLIDNLGDLSKLINENLHLLTHNQQRHSKATRQSASQTISSLIELEHDFADTERAPERFQFEELLKKAERVFLRFMPVLDEKSAGDREISQQYHISLGTNPRWTSIFEGKVIEGYLPEWHFNPVFKDENAAIEPLVQPLRELCLSGLSQITEIRERYGNLNIHPTNPRDELNLVADTLRLPDTEIDEAMGSVASYLGARSESFTR